MEKQKRAKKKKKALVNWEEETVCLIMTMKKHRVNQEKVYLMKRMMIKKLLWEGVYLVEETRKKEKHTKRKHGEGKL